MQIETQFNLINLVVSKSYKVSRSNDIQHLRGLLSKTLIYFVVSKSYKIHLRKQKQVTKFHTIFTKTEFGLVYKLYGHS
ncbi:hypothetical protein QE152_g1283 [Popillia japonica]|uniref:Ribosomal protein L23 n=1 Tax=Popillia japonica TaxID=7064 RepID=A0AAW1N365_POPJA